MVHGEEREEAVRPDRGLSAGPSSCRLVTVRATTFLLCQPSEHRTGLRASQQKQHISHRECLYLHNLSAVEGLTIRRYFIDHLFIGSSRRIEVGDIKSVYL